SNGASANHTNFHLTLPEKMRLLKDTSLFKNERQEHKSPTSFCSSESVTNLVFHFRTMLVW
ncbi:hypothetical protein, partial [Vibrio sp. 2089]|uniref:hypothetical protein n=1 Tax=Vibrio sp. 2089 TaxID=3074591 RepID=UPI0029647F31